MTSCPYLFSLAQEQLTASFYISPWLPLLLSAVSLALLSVSFWALWSSVRCLDGLLTKINSVVRWPAFVTNWQKQRKELQRLKAEKAVTWFRVVGRRLCWGVVLLATGWGIHDIEEYHSTYVLADAAVERQTDQYLAYHFIDDPERHSYGIKFCDDFVPDFQPRQIIKVMVYVRKSGCESVAPYKAGIQIRRVNGVPILEGE